MWKQHIDNVQPISNTQSWVYGFLCMFFLLLLKTNAATWTCIESTKDDFMTWQTCQEC